MRKNPTPTVDRRKICVANDIGWRFIGMSKLPSHMTSLAVLFMEVVIIFTVD